MTTENIHSDPHGEMITDPVCGMTIEYKESAITYDYRGRTYYFCSDECCDKFSESARGEE